MTKKTLADLLGPREEDKGALRWEVTVPLWTNPFILMELFQFAFVGAAIAVLTLCTGAWVMEGRLTAAEAAASLSIGAMILVGVMAGFVALVSIFFGNRYYSVYRMDAGGIYHEGSRGGDGRGEWLTLRMRPYPVVGTVRAERTRSRYLQWDKVDRFHAIASMRTILLRRGFWHLLRLYLPDDETYRQAVALLAMRLNQ